MMDTQKCIVLSHLEQVAATFELVGGVDPERADEIAVAFCLEAIEKALEKGKRIFTDEEFEQLGNILTKAKALDMMIESDVADHLEANRAAIREALGLPSEEEK